MVQLHFLPVKTASTRRKTKRELELEAVDARSHAARISHFRAGRGKRTRPQSSRRWNARNEEEAVDHQNQEEHDEPRTLFQSNSYAVVSPPAFEGNSDPFDCFDLAITPELNQLIAFTRDVGIPAHFTPLVIRSMKASSSFTPSQSQLERPTITRSCTEIYASLGDEGTALARLIGYGQTLAKCQPDPSETLLLTLKMRGRSTTLLRQKLEQHNRSSASEADIASLQHHIFGLFSSYSSDDDFNDDKGSLAAARLHITALRKLLDNGQEKKADVFFMNKLIYVNISTAAVTGRRTLAEIDDWCLQALEQFFG